MRADDRASESVVMRQATMGGLYICRINRGCLGPGHALGPVNVSMQCRFNKNCTNLVEIRIDYNYYTYILINDHITVVTIKVVLEAF